MKGVPQGAPFFVSPRQRQPFGNAFARMVLAMVCEMIIDPPFARCLPSVRPKARRLLSGDRLHRESLLDRVVRGTAFD